MIKHNIMIPSIPLLLTMPRSILMIQYCHVTREFLNAWMMVHNLTGLLMYMTSTGLSTSKYLMFLLVRFLDDLIKIH